MIVFKRTRGKLIQDTSPRQGRNRVRRPARVIPPAEGVSLRSTKLASL